MPTPSGQTRGFGQSTFGSRRFKPTHKGVGAHWNDEGFYDDPTLAVIVTGFELAEVIAKREEADEDESGVGAVRVFWIQGGDVGAGRLGFGRKNFSTDPDTSAGGGDTAANQGPALEPEVVLARLERVGGLQSVDNFSGRTHVIFGPNNARHGRPSRQSVEERIVCRRDFSTRREASL